MRGFAEVRLQPHALKPVTAHLRRALDEGRQSVLAPLVRRLDAVAPLSQLAIWLRKVPKGLQNSYAFAKTASAQGPVNTDGIILGVVLFGPGCTYPVHAHQGITESYVCLSGAASENHQGVYVPGLLIFDPLIICTGSPLASARLPC